MNRCIRSSYSYIFRSLTVTLLLILSFVLSVSCTISNATDTSTGIDGEIRVLQATQTIVDSIALSSDLILYVDPPNGHTSPTILGVFARASDVDALVYYEPSDESPTIDSPFITYNTPYIELGTLFKGSRNRTLTMVAVLTDELGTIRSEQITMDYFVEGASRPFSYGFMIPGVESGGYFLRFGMEVAAVARAQVAGGQEFADFFSELGKGTYIDQVDALNLLSLDPDLQGFEGGFPGKYATY